MLNSLALSTLIFLILYAILFFILLADYHTKRIKLRSRYSLITFHVLIRLASQSVGLAFGIIGFKSFNLLIAYLILGAEGYFSLVLCTARFLISWHNHNLLAKNSWLEPRRPKGEKWYKGLIVAFNLKATLQGTGSPMGIIHWLLIAANAIIITGGNLLSGDTSDPSQNWDDNSSIQLAKILRAVGQAIFLAVNMVFFGCIIYTIKQSRREVPSRPFYGHPTLLILVLTWPFLGVRGIFGVLQAVLTKLNYYYPGNYNETGFIDQFVIEETLLATLMEWTSCALLISTYFTSRGDPSSADRKESELKLNDEEKSVSE